jgi:hypothetical protein
MATILSIPWKIKLFLKHSPPNIFRIIGFVSREFVGYVKGNTLNGGF